MRGLEDDADALRIQYLIDSVRDLRCHLLLNLQSFRVNINDTCELTDANHAAPRDIRDPCATDDRRHVMLAMAFEPHIAKHDHLVISLGFFEGLLQDIGWILRIT